jgi:integration host factor subunit beta
MKTITKRDLVDRICSKRPDLRKGNITDTVQLFMDVIIEALSRGDRVELRDFGVFSAKVRDARVARNPKTGGAVDVPATRVASFKVGKEMKRRVASSYEPEE